MPSDNWTILPSKPSTFKFRNQAYNTYLRADNTVKTPSGKLNVYASRTDPSIDDGNSFIVEPSGGFAGDAWTRTGYFRVKSVKTGDFVMFSEADFTPNGKKEVCQTTDSTQAAVLYLG